MAAQFLQPFARPRRFALLWQKMPPFCLHHSSRLRGVHGTNLPYPGLRRLAFITQSVTHAVTLSLVTTLGHSHVGHPSAEMESVSLPHSSTEISIWGYEKKNRQRGRKIKSGPSVKINTHTHTQIHARARTWVAKTSACCRRPCSSSSFWDISVNSSVTSWDTGCAHEGEGETHKININDEFMMLLI